MGADNERLQRQNKEHATSEPKNMARMKSAEFLSLWFQINASIYNHARSYSVQAARDTSYSRFDTHSEDTAKLTHI